MKKVLYEINRVKNLQMLENLHMFCNEWGGLKNKEEYNGNIITLFDLTRNLYLTELCVVGGKGELDKGTWIGKDNKTSSVVKYITVRHVRRPTGVDAR